MLALLAEPHSVGQVFNIGNGAEVSIRELANMVVAMTGSVSEVQFVPYHQVFGQNFEDMSRRVADIGKIRPCVGYEPQVHLKEILRRVIPYWATQLPIGAAARMPIGHQPAALIVH